MEIASAIVLLEKLESFWNGMKRSVFKSASRHYSTNLGSLENKIADRVMKAAAVNKDGV